VYFCFELGLFVLELVELDAVWDLEDDFEEYLLLEECLLLDDFWEVWLRLLNRILAAELLREQLAAPKTHLDFEPHVACVDMLAKVFMWLKRGGQGHVIYWC
jgi:hypothetical protein